MIHRLLSQLVVLAALCIGAGSLYAALNDREEATGVITAADFFPSITPSPTPSPQPTGTPYVAPRMFIDTDVASSPANTATSYGSTETCASLSVGQTLQIDIIATWPEGGIDWFQFILLYDPDVVHVVSVDNRMILTQLPGARFFEIQGAPDSSGSFFDAAFDLATNHEPSPGLLARVTLEAVGTGETSLEFDTPQIETNGGNLLFPLPEDATVRVGSFCPGQTPTPHPTASPGAVTATPTPTPTPTASPSPTAVPHTASPTAVPTATPTVTPSASPTTSATVVPSATPIIAVPGDADCNGVAGTSDVLAQLTGGGSDSDCLTASGADPGDIDCDGVVGPLDALRLLMWLAGVTGPPAECSP